jgi:hypothetical protein
VLTCGVTTSLSMMSVVLSGWTPEPGSGPVLSEVEGSVRVAEMTGQGEYYTLVKGWVNAEVVGDPALLAVRQVARLGYHRAGNVGC